MIAAAVAVIIGVGSIYLRLRPEFDNVKEQLYRNLTDEELEILKKRLKTNKILYILALVALIFISTILILYVLFTHDYNIGIIIVTLIFLALIYNLIRHLREDSSDLKGSVIRIEGPIYRAIGIRLNRLYDFKVGKYSFHYSDLRPGLEVSDILNARGKVSIEFSPHSKVIWNIRKVS